MPRRFLRCESCRRGGRNSFCFSSAAESWNDLPPTARSRSFGRVQDRIPDRLGLQPLQPETPQIGVARHRSSGSPRTVADPPSTPVDRCPTSRSAGAATSCCSRARRIRRPGSRAVSDCDGLPPSTPKSLVDALQALRRNASAQMRFTATRANSGFSGAVSQSTNAFAPAVAEIHVGRLEGKAGLDRLVFLRPLRIAGGEDVALSLSAALVFFHRPVRRAASGRGPASSVAPAAHRTCRSPPSA